MSERNPVLLCDVLAELLEYGGILSETPPVLYVWRAIAGIERRIEVKTFEEFLNIFGLGTYQIYVANPNIDGIDPEKFTVNSFSVIISYLGDGKWSTPRIQTDEEEITPEYAENFKVTAMERAKKMAKKGEGALTILSLFLDFYKMLKGLAGS